MKKLTLTTQIDDPVYNLLHAYISSIATQNPGTRKADVVNAILREHLERVALPAADFEFTRPVRTAEMLIGGESNFLGWRDTTTGVVWDRFMQSRTATPQELAWVNPAKT